VVWECAIKGRKEDELDKLGETVVRWLKSNDGFGEIKGNHCVLVKKNPRNEIPDGNEVGSSTAESSITTYLGTL